MMRQAYIAYSLPMVTATLFDEHIEAGSDGEFYTSLIWLAALLFTQAALSILHGWYNPSGEDFKPVSAQLLGRCVKSPPCGKRGSLEGQEGVRRRANTMRAHCPRTSSHPPQSPAGGQEG
eukprot:83286-Prorocentrum_minimum.AAC.3